MAKISGAWTERHQTWLRLLAMETRRRRYRCVSEHFCFATAGDFVHGAPLPVPLTEKTLALGRARLARMREAAGVPVGLENLAIALGRHDVDAQGQFLDELLRRGRRVWPRLCRRVPGCPAAAAGRFRERVIKDVRQDVQLLQTVQGALTLKAAGREDVAQARWLHLFAAALNAKVREVRLAEGVGVALAAIRAAAPLLVLCWGAKLVLGGELSLGVLLGLLMLQAAFLQPLAQIIEALLSLRELPVQLARMDDVLETAAEASGRRPAPRLGGSVTFEGVSFHYGPNAPPVVRDLSLTIGRGEKVALVGPLGSGKSTVARLLLGL
jgi:hypothetical protein